MKAKKKSNSLRDRLKKSYDTRERGAGSRSSAMDWKKIDDIKFYKPKEGKNKINIIPYLIKTKNDPLVKTNDAKVGDESYMLDVYFHNNIGPTQAQVVCLKETYGKPCPICELRQQYYNEGKRDEAGALKPKRTCFYNIQDVKNDPDTLQVWNISHFLFEKELIEEAFFKGEDGEPVDFVDIDDGKTIVFRASDTDSLINGKKVTFMEFKSFDFIERDEPIEESLIKKTVSFDELLIVHTYDELKKILYGEDEEDEEDEEDNENIEDDDEDIEDEDEDEEEDDEEEEDEEEEDDEEEVKPVKKRGRKPSVKKEETKKEKVKKDTNKCPNGHKFGKDNDKYEDDCDDCDIWAECKRENKKLKK